MGRLVGGACLADSRVFRPGLQVHLYRLLIPMSRREVLVALIIAVVVVGLADLLTRRRTANVVPRQVIRTIASAPPHVDVLGIGNSLIAADFDRSAIERTYRESGRSCAAINGGLGSSGVIEHLALTRLALRDRTVDTLVYGFFDQQMFLDVAASNSELVGNYNMHYYLEPQLTLEYARFNTFERLSFQAYRFSALLRERGSIWADVEKLRRAIGSVGMPPAEASQFGRKADFALLEAGSANSFLRRCQRLIRSGDFLAPPIQALLRQARERGVTVVVVEMPVHPRHFSRYYSQPIWDEFRRGTRLAVERMGASYINASAWTPDASLFVDPLHLSKEGAKQFSERLARQMLQRPQ